MNNLTKMKINASPNVVFEALVDPVKIGNYWFSSNSERWGEGKTIILRYDEYNAVGEIVVTEIVENRKIAFQWGAAGEEHAVTISLIEEDDQCTIVLINEEGFKESDEDIIQQLVGNKEGWVYMLTCLKAYLEFGVSTLRAGLVK